MKPQTMLASTALSTCILLSTTGITYATNITDVPSANQTSVNRLHSLSTTPINESHNTTTTYGASKLSSSEIAEVEAELEKYGVQHEVTEDLIEKLQEGQVWDSMQAGTTPISTSRQEDGLNVEIIDTYADGSIAVSTVSDTQASKERLENGDPEARSVYGCVYTSGGYYAGYWKNCTADVNLILVRMGFTFDYQSVRGIGPEITAYRNYFHHVIGSSMSNFRFDRLSKREVRLSADTDAFFKGFPIGWTAWMQVTIDGTVAKTSHN